MKKWSELVEAVERKALRNAGWTRQQAQAMAKSFEVEKYLTAKAVQEGPEWAVILIKARKP